MTLFVCVSVIGLAIWWADNFIAPLFLNSRIERLSEKDLPKITVENGSAIYCRMKADDFRFPLPPRSRATDLTLSGGFDSVDGSLKVYFETTNHVTARQYASLLKGKVPVGGRVESFEMAGGLLIEFHYFGDK